jgi:FMN phosphatase YigB (HAD superfamily)
MKLLIVDVDDTLFDWLSMWSQSFATAFDEVAARSTLSRDELIPAFRAMHIGARTSERGLHIGDAAALGIDPDPLAEIARTLEANRHRLTLLYPAVLDTIRSLSARGVRIAAHTDTPMNVASERFVRLGLDGVVEALFAAPSLGVTVFRETTAMPSRSTVVELREMKPDPAAVRTILTYFRVTPAECVYVGDSKMKDIPMARAAGVRDVFAAYGCKRSSDAYDLLRAVGHWTDEEIAREKALLRADASTQLHSFAELLELA